MLIAYDLLSRMAAWLQALFPGLGNSYKCALAAGKASVSVKTATHLSALIHTTLRRCSLSHMQASRRSGRGRYAATLRRLQPVAPLFTLSQLRSGGTHEVAAHAERALQELLLQAHVARTPSPALSEVQAGGKSYPFRSCQRYRLAANPTPSGPVRGTGWRQTLPLPAPSEVQAGGKPYPFRPRQRYRLAANPTPSGRVRGTGWRQT